MLKRLLSGRAFKRVISTVLAISISFTTLSVGSFSVDDPIPTDATEVETAVDETSETTESTEDTESAEATENTETTETTENTTVSDPEVSDPSTSETSPEEENSETTESSETTTEPEAEPAPEYVSSITVTKTSETDTSVTLSGYNLPEAII
jgi:trehalose/maltose hydrolase-like predicted phosphorylase